MMNGKVLGIDWGTKRIGLAISDMKRRFVFPYRTLENKKLLDIFQEILAIVYQEGIGEIVVGMPKSLHGGANQQAKTVQAFIEKLRVVVNCPIQIEDERLSTKLAERMLQLGRRSRRSRKIRVDESAAVLILETYLERSRCRP